MMRLKTECELAKRELSEKMNTEIAIEPLVDGENYKCILTRIQFEELCEELFAKIIPIVERVLIDSKLEKSDIHEVVLVGGSTRMPKIQTMLKKYFPRSELNKSINPDEAVA